MCEGITTVINGEKLFIDMKHKCGDERENQESALVTSEAMAFNNIIDVLSKITPEDMLIAPQEEPKIGKAMRYLKVGQKPYLAKLQKFKSNYVRKHLLQFD